MKEIINRLSQAKVIPVIRKATKDNILAVADRLYKAGIKVVEITVENPEGYEAIRFLKENRPKMLVGAGTVLTVGEAERAIQQGATFIFSPIVREEVIRYVKQNQAISIPGVFTPTEVYQAIAAGADMVKIFPIAQLGKQYLKNISAPLPPIPKIVTGGVTLDEVPEYLAAGACGVGIGSELVNLDKVAVEGESALLELEEKVQRLMDKLNSLEK